MNIQLPQYTGKDYLVLAMVLLPFTVMMNSILFGAMYYSSLALFLESTLITAIGFALDFTLCGFVAVLLKERFPEECQMGRKLSMMIITFLVISGLFLLVLFKGYEIIHFHGYTFNERGFIWAYVFLGILNIFLTFLFEGIAHFQNWQANLRATEDLKKVYQQGQLQGLKSQVNPHFLFNSLNSLSSLIQEDEEEAELFLDEMTKVYRYMLRNDEDQLVALATELKFLESYLYLLHKRFGAGLVVSINVDSSDLEKQLPPMALQVLVENAFSHNVINKKSPLSIDIYSEDNLLIVKNIVQPKVIKETIDGEPGLDNLLKKYKYLNHSDVVIDNRKDFRFVRLPLLKKKEGAV